MYTRDLISQPDDESFQFETNVFCRKVSCLDRCDRTSGCGLIFELSRQSTFQQPGRLRECVPQAKPVVTIGFFISLFSKKRRVQEFDYLNSVVDRFYRTLRNT